MRSPRVAVVVGAAGLLVACAFRLSGYASSTPEAEQSAARRPAAARAPIGPAYRALVNDHCLDCHDNGGKEAGLSLEAIVAEDVAKHPDIWEKVVRKLRTRQMPPVGEGRPNDATYVAAIASLEKALDLSAAARPNPGRTAT